MGASSNDPTRPWSTGGDASPFSVTFWGSNPDETDNDDCWTGTDFGTEAEAREYLAAALGGRIPSYCGDSAAYVMLDGPGAHTVAPVPAYHAPGAAEKRARREAREARAERSEYATQAGMSFGCDGYNDAMGY